MLHHSPLGRSAWNSQGKYKFLLQIQLNPDFSLEGLFRVTWCNLLSHYGQLCLSASRHIKGTDIFICIFFLSKAIPVIFCMSFVYLCMRNFTLILYLVNLIFISPVFCYLNKQVVQEGKLNPDFTCPWSVLTKSIHICTKWKGLPPHVYHTDPWLVGKHGGGFLKGIKDHL